MPDLVVVKATVARGRKKVWYALDGESCTEVEIDGKDGSMMDMTTDKADCGIQRTAGVGEDARCVLGRGTARRESSRWLTIARMRTIDALFVMTLAGCSNPPPVAPPAGDPMASAAAPATPALPDTPPTQATPPTPTLATTPPPTPSTPPVASSAPSTPPTPGPVTLSGTVDGVAFAAKDAFVMLSTNSDGIVSFATAVVMLTDFANACATVTATPNLGNASAVKLDIGTFVDGSTALPIPTGTIRVPSEVKKGAISASVRFTTVGAKGQTTKQLAATSGTLTITTLTPTHIAGSIDVKFARGALKGTFDAPLCAGLK